MFSKKCLYSPAVKKTAESFSLRKMPFLRFFLAALCVPVLFGCATMRAAEDHIEPNITSLSTIYIDQWTVRNPPEVHVQPRQQATYSPRVLFVPFRVTQKMDNPGMVSHSVSRTVYQTWNTMQLFPAMEYASDPTPYRRDVALALARQRGADMVVGGFVTYVYAGGSIGDTQLSIQVEAHDVATGQLVWSMGQSGLIPAAKQKDYIFFATQTRLPTDPVHAIARSLAIDMGKQMQNWLAPAPPVSPSSLDRADQRVKDALFPDRDPMPAPRKGPDENAEQQPGGAF